MLEKLIRIPSDPEMAHIVMLTFVTLYFLLRFHLRDPRE